MATLLQVKDIVKKHGPRALLDGASVSISEGQKIGFIGRNGAGKTTLLRIITGEETPDSGEILRLPNLRLGYLEQQERFVAGETVAAYLERRSGKEEWECAKMAARFQLKKDSLETEVLALSGGYQMRVKLAAMLLKDPNFLILDEPTNYLDLNTLLLLEDVLRDFRGGFLVVSHDREFIKNTCDETLEVERGQLTSYPGGIEEYLEFKEARMEEMKRYNKKIEIQRRHLQEFIDRFRYKASKAAQAQNKIKQRDRLQAIEIAHKLKTVRIDIPGVEAKKGLALRAKELSIGYPGKVVASGINFEIQRGEHAAILGENGQGKSTLLKTVAGLLAPIDGSFAWGYKLKVGYYAQQIYEMILPQDTVESYLERMAAPGIIKEEILYMAGNFLFTFDDLEKPVSILSGGERARLCLAGLLLERNDVLVLDEPTNHLDVETVEALGASLAEFPGTVIFVSHDRTFVNLLANAILEVKAGQIVRYPHTYEEYVYYLSKEFGIAREEPKAEEPVAVEVEGEEKMTRQEIYERMTECSRAISRIEKQIVEYRAEHEKIMQEYLEHPGEFNRVRDERLKTVEGVMKGLEEKWFELQGELEKLRRA